MRLLLNKALFAVVMLSASVVLHAADAARPDSAKAAAPAATDSATAKSDAAKPAAADGKTPAKTDDKPASTSEPFVPTAKISEDLSVSFPADI